MTARVQPLGETADGIPVKRVSITGGGPTAHILTSGATVKDRRMDGTCRPLALGAPTLAPNFALMTSFGAIVGRLANRIAAGHFEVHGETHQVSVNWLDRHALHGGTVGSGQKVWTIGGMSEGSLGLDFVLADGDMGFPRNIAVSAAFSLPGKGVLAMDVQTCTDAACPCSFAHHGYFALDHSGDITGHWLRIDAHADLPLDADLIPTGAPAPVAGTAFDFQAPRAIGKTGGDHDFCLSETHMPLRPVAELRSPQSGLAVTVETTEPGLQVHDGAYIPAPGLDGLGGRRYEPFAGIALDTQAWPDAPDRPDFPSAILAPGETCDHQVRHRFHRESDQ